MNKHEATGTDRLVKVVRPLPSDCIDGRAGVRALLLEVETRFPGILEQVVSGLQLQRLIRCAADGARANA